MIPVGADELSRAAAALEHCSEGPIFLQSNIHNHGLAREGSDHRAVHLWRTPDWTGFTGLTAGGVLMPQMRDAGQGWSGLRPALQGRRIVGANGESGQVVRAIEMLGLTDAPTALNREEPGFELDLKDMIVPDVGGLWSQPLRDVDRDLLLGWRAAYRVEILGDTPAEAARTAPAEIDDWMRDGSHRLIWQDDRPVSLAGVNARLPGLVQIGGVYTPPELRRRGLARRAVAMLLAEMRGRGATRACLFAASAQAARAYIAIGFRHSGTIRMVFFSQPVEVTP
ncbi:GNAT family N-acetyltransferase [Paracoccus caeni]|uniref:GNAT family N-acetyltransferase n=1 Tax=Paracoccus caeni TaxID=657651 RepID=A0A934SF22_9RHOB|nr:GNAT family N-acetyltransferase [Paracoccus caeni]MBK4216189.1 GNAT family N-acetyltransferase [Paracoccus caeni]